MMMMKMSVDDDRELPVRADLTTNQFSCSVAKAWVAFNTATTCPFTNTSTFSKQSYLKLSKTFSMSSRKF